MKLQVKIEIDTIKVAELLCSGMEGGINYWAGIKEYKEPQHPVSFLESNNNKKIYPHIDYPLTEDGAVVLQDAEDNFKEYTLDLKSIKEGLQIMSQKYPKHFSDFMSGDYDATTGDVFIQCCLLKEIVYG